MTLPRLGDKITLTREATDQSRSSAGIALSGCVLSLQRPHWAMGFSKILLAKATAATRLHNRLSGMLRVLPSCQGNDIVPLEIDKAVAFRPLFYFDGW